MSVHAIETLVFAAGIASVSYMARWLSFDGAIAQFILATLLFGLGNWQWSVPILVFFLTSSALSRFTSVRKVEAAGFFSKGGIRDAAQVAANGGIGGILVLGWRLFPHPAWFIAYLSSIAAAASDTWATELGVLSSRGPILITSMNPVPAGSSGGVSLLGSFAALAGGAVVFLAGFSWLEPESACRSAYVVVFAGFTGSVVDSLIGATLQSQFRCSSCGKMTEKHIHCGLPAHQVRGISWIDNEVVNLACTTWGALIGGVASLLFT